MNNIKLKRISFTGVSEKKPIVMETPSLKVMVKNLTDSDIYVGIGTEDEVTIDNAVQIKANCYQIVFINENIDCCCMFSNLVVMGEGTGTVECIQVLF